MNGLKVAVINPKTGKIDFSEIFDTSKTSDLLEELIFSNIPKGHIISAVSKGDCISELSTRSRKWF